MLIKTIVAAYGYVVVCNFVNKHYSILWLNFNKEKNETLLNCYFQSNNYLRNKFTRLKVITVLYMHQLTRRNQVSQKHFVQTGLDAIRTVWESHYVVLGLHVHTKNGVTNDLSTKCSYTNNSKEGKIKIVEHKTNVAFDVI